VLWELLAGEVPFKGDNFVAVALRHVNEPVPHLRDARPDVSPRLAAAVERALAKDPAHRFPSMAALGKELRACLAEGDGAAPLAQDEAALTLITPPTTAPAPPRRVRRRRSRRHPLAWALLALAVAGAAFAAVVLLGGGSNHDNGGPGGGGGGPGATVGLTALAGYDPEGDGTEHNERVGLATDSNPSTYWMTEHYDSQDFGGLKSGVGLVLDAGSSVKLAQLTVTTPTPGFTAEIQAGESATGSFTDDSSSQSVQGTTTFTLNGATARYYVIWITQLPATGGRAEISEVTATS
jgi:hypothetical protein